MNVDIYNLKKIEERLLRKKKKIGKEARVLG